MNKTIKKARKGFSLVELVIAILIIAVLVAAVFAGGSIIIRNSQVSRTTSDLHNFSIAMETWMNQNPTLSNILVKTGDADDLKAGARFNGLIDEFNKLLAEDYKLERELKDADAGAAANAGNTAYPGTAAVLPQYVDVKVGAESRVFESKKTDAWGNPYYVVFDCEDRNASESEFYVYVISAGPNAKTSVDGAIDADDVFVLAQYTNGTVVSNIYNMNDVNGRPNDVTGAEVTMAAAGKYSVNKLGTAPASTTATDATTAAAGKVPVNFAK